MPTALDSSATENLMDGKPVQVKQEQEEECVD
jgi:hypothetical protein